MTQAREIDEKAFWDSVVSDIEARFPNIMAALLRAEQVPAGGITDSGNQI